MSRTTKPCPGCGNVDRYRKRDAVCQACARALKWAEDNRDNTHNAVVNKQVAAYTQQDQSGMLYYPHASADTDMSRELRLVIAALLQRLSKPAPPDGGLPTLMPLVTPSRDFANYGRTTVLFSPEDAELVRRLDQTVRAALGNAYANGLRDAGNTIRSLINGTITVNDFVEQMNKILPDVFKTETIEARLVLQFKPKE